MRCPTLADLPPPPEGKKGWPWTEETPRAPESMPGEKSWPRISIVTPSYNQGQFIEETIRSVLLQGYPDLEYIIMDGGSTDQSVSIIERYEDFLTYWVSKPDGGQSRAIVKAFDMATGDIVAWLNSDDIYLPGTLQKISGAYSVDPSVEWWIGNTLMVDQQNHVVKRWYARPTDLQKLLYSGMTAAQPSTFWRYDKYLEYGRLDADMQFCFDYDLNIRFAQKTSPTRIDAFLSAFRFHPESKTCTLASIRHEEDQQVWQRYGRQSGCYWHAFVMTVYHKLLGYIWYSSRRFFDSSNQNIPFILE